MRIWKRPGELKKKRKKRRKRNFTSGKELEGTTGKPPHETVVAATPPGVFTSVYTSEYTSARSHSQLVAFFFFFFANPCMTIKSNCTSPFGRGHKRPPQYFFTMSLSLMSISLSDKGPRLNQHSYLNVPSTRLQKHNSWDMYAKIRLKELIQSPQMKWEGKKEKKKENAVAYFRTNAAQPGQRWHKTGLRTQSSEAGARVL